VADTDDARLHIGRCERVAVIDRVRRLATRGNSLRLLSC